MEGYEAYGTDPNVGAQKATDPDPEHCSYSGAFKT
jgi:hypothetical protein